MFIVVVVVVVFNYFLQVVYRGQGRAIDCFYHSCTRLPWFKIKNLIVAVHPLPSILAEKTTSNKWKPCFHSAA